LPAGKDRNLPGGDHAKKSHKGGEAQVTMVKTQRKRRSPNVKKGKNIYLSPLSEEKTREKQNVGKRKN